MFRKYQHIERIGTSLPKDYLKGTIYIFPKLDGTNSSVWLENNILKAGSRKRELSLEQDNADFYANIKDNDNLLKFLNDYPHYRIFGEWLVPHTLKNYEDTAWKKFYIFDIIDESNVSNDISSENYRKYIKYIPYEEYSELLQKYNLDFVSCCNVLINPKIDKIYDCLCQNGYLTTDGNGEGLIIKNYDYINECDVHNAHWVKLINKEFLELKLTHIKTQKIIQSNCIEELIVENFVTESFIEKEYAKILNNNLNIEHNKLIPMLLNKIFYELIQEETWNIIKKYKLPTINYKLLNKLVINKIKKIKNNLF